MSTAKLILFMTLAVLACIGLVELVPLARGTVWWIYGTGAPPS